MKKTDLYSIIQPDFRDLILTGEYAVHHVFPGRNRKKCEHYGFLVALRPWQHDEVHRHPNGVANRSFQKMCYDYWIENIGSADEFRKEFY